MRTLVRTSVGVLALAAAMQPAAAADMPVKAPAAVAPIYNWTGFYIGATAGWGWGRSQHFNSGIPGPKFDINGAVAGGTLGYNWQAGRWVFGVEGDLSWSNIEGSGANTPTFTCGALGCVTEVRWFGTARGRIGLAFDRVLPYVTGGAAFGRLHGALPSFAGIAGSDTKAGWTIGAGLEITLAQQWSAKVEYLYLDFGKFHFATIVATFPSFDADARFSVIRAGLNYRFGGAAPVVARY